MALLEGQAQIRGLLLGPGTPYELFRFNPFRRRVRSPSKAGRAWNHGGWSGAEWMEPRTIPMRIIVSDQAVTRSTWSDLDHALAEAFAPVGDQTEDVELTFRVGGRDYLLLGRPQGIDPDSEHVGDGWSLTQAAFRADHPFILSAEQLIAGPVALPRTVGGMTVPLRVPLRVTATIVGGEVDLIHEGTAESGLLVRIDGPVPEPRITLQRSDGVIQTLRWQGLILPEGQFLDVDTAARQAFLNGLPTASAHPGFTQWPMLPGREPDVSASTSRLLFRAAEVTTATMTVMWRHRWW